MMTRRQFVATSMAALNMPAHSFEDAIAPYRTPYKFPTLLLGPTNHKGDFDEKSVDDPIVFRAPSAGKDHFYMLYIGFDGTGYQTGLATSPDLLEIHEVQPRALQHPAR
jgi:hypothetical protein